METLKIEIDPGLKADLLTAAARQNQTPESLAHEILRGYLDNEYLISDKEAAAGLAEAEEAWAEFQRTGEGVTLEEATAWLDSWGTDNPPPAPKCRKL